MDYYTYRARFHNITSKADLYFIRQKSKRQKVRGKYKTIVTSPIGTVYDQHVISAAPMNVNGKDTNGSLITFGILNGEMKEGDVLIYKLMFEEKGFYPEYLAVPFMYRESAGLRAITAHLPESPGLRYNNVSLIKGNFDILTRDDLILYNHDLKDNADFNRYVLPNEDDFIWDYVTIQEITKGSPKPETFTMKDEIDGKENTVFIEPEPVRSIRTK